VWVSVAELGTVSLERVVVGISWEQGPGSVDERLELGHLSLLTGIGLLPKLDHLACLFAGVEFADSEKIRIESMV
jgi:hypothetical protein